MSTGAAVLDFADSEAGSVAVQGSALVLRLAAAQVVQGGETGYLLGVQARFDGARWQGDPAACAGRIRSSQLTVGGERRSRLDLPFAAATVQATFLFQNGEQLRVDADALCIEPGEARFVPSYAC